jgi:hypothetical protein
MTGNGKPNVDAELAAWRLVKLVGKAKAHALIEAVEIVEKPAPPPNGNAIDDKRLPPIEFTR